MIPTCANSREGELFDSDRKAYFLVSKKPTTGLGPAPREPGDGKIAVGNVSVLMTKAKETGASRPNTGSPTKTESPAERKTFPRKR